MSRRLAAAAAVFALLAAPARAHETLHEVRRGEAVAVKAWTADGEVLAYVPYEVWSPSDPRVPWQKGRTDRAGWLAFVPDVPGKWRVRVADEGGHGLEVEIDAAAPAGGPGAAPPSGAAFVLRPLLGVALIATIFAGLWFFQRRRGAAR